MINLIRYLRTESSTGLMLRNRFLRRSLQSTFFVSFSLIEKNKTFRACTHREKYKFSFL